MIKIERKEQCCGCSACANICPRNCISLQPDIEGFLYPKIESDYCIECHLCEKVCPINKPVNTDEFVRYSYAVRTKENSILLQSTSGGFFTPLADWIISQNGIVCAARFDDDFRVVHDFISSDEVALDNNIYEKFRGSKYVQSDMGDCFKRIKEYLQDNIMVCFIGTTCQVSGLKKFLQKDYLNLITVDLVCHGTPSPKLWKKYIDYQEKKYNSSIKSISFRNKTYGYHSGTMKISFENGKMYYGSARVDYMLKSFFKEISSRPICYECPFKKTERCSDITIYDCWHIESLVPEMVDDDKGFTNVIIQSEKGGDLLEQLKNEMEIYEVDIDKAIALDGVMVQNSAIAHSRRAEFYQELDDTPLPQHIQKFIPISALDHVIEKMKFIVYRLGILQKLKKILKK